MDRIIREIFEYQKFERNEHLEHIIRETESKFINAQQQKSMLDVENRLALMRDIVGQKCNETERAIESTDGYTSNEIVEF